MRPGMLEAGLEGWRVAWFRAGFAIYCGAAFHSAGLSLNPMFERFAWFQKADSIYDSLFLTPIFYAGIWAALLAFALGVAPRLTGFLAGLLLLPLAFLSDGMQSRHVLLVALACLALYPGPGTRLWSCHRSEPGTAPFPWWPIGLVLFQISVIYGFNALAKLNPEYLSGEVLEGMHEFKSSFHLIVRDGAAEVMGMRAPAWPLACASAVAEGMLAWSVWARTPRGRLVAWCAVVAFHLMLLPVMGIFRLNITCIALLALYFVFIPPPPAVAHREPCRPA